MTHLNLETSKQFLRTPRASSRTSLQIFWRSLRDWICHKNVSCRCGGTLTRLEEWLEVENRNPFMRTDPEKVETWCTYQNHICCIFLLNYQSCLACQACQVVIKIKQWMICFNIHLSSWAQKSRKHPTRTQYVHKSFPEGSWCWCHLHQW